MLFLIPSASPLCNQRGAIGDGGEDDDGGKGDLPPDDSLPPETDKLLADLGHTAEELADLSEEEKEGLLMKDEDEEVGEEEGSDTKAALEAIAKEAETVEEKTAREATEAAALAAQGKTAEELASEAAKPEGSSAAVPDEELLKFRPVIAPAELPATDAVPEALATKLTDLDEKYDAGDIDMKGYMAERDKVNREIYRAQEGAVKQARETLEWQKTQKFFFQNRQEYLRLPTVTDTKELIRRDVLFGALGKMVESITNDPTKAHLTDIQILIEADKAVKDAFGIKPAAAGPGKEKVIDIAKGKPPAPLPDHVTLGDIPAAGAEDVGDDPYSALDKLSGEAYEAALERLTPQQKDAYEAGASRPARRRVA